MDFEDNYEMDDLAEKFPEYDDLTIEDLNESLSGLNDRLLNDNDPLITERITYINDLLSHGVREGGAETNFGGVRNETYAQLDKYVQDSNGVKLDPYSESVIELRRRVTLKDGKVTFKVKLKNGELSSSDNIVLNRNVDKYETNTAKRNTLAVSQFKELIDRATTESRERQETVGDLPMIDARGSELPRDLFDRLNEKDQRVVNGILDPSDTILPESRIGSKGAIQLMVDEFRERSNIARDNIRNSDLVEAQKLFQESVDLDLVADAFEEQRIKEETRGVQEEDVSRLQKIKKWFKENWIGASALGITVAGLITTIIVGARSAIVKGTNTALSFAKAVKNAIAKMGPWAASLANLAYNIIKAGAHGVAFLSKNLWIVVITISYFLWEMYKNKTV